MAHDRHNRLRIATGEGVEFGLEIAGPVTRMLAWFLDAVVIIGLTLILEQILSMALVGLRMVLAGAAFDFVAAMRYVGVFVISLGYGVFMEWRHRGQTIGKRVLRLRVVDAEGLKLRFSQVLLRNLLRFVDMIPFLYLVGGAVMAFNRYSQRLGDLAAGTVVVRIPTVEPAPQFRFEEGKYNTLREHPLVVTRLRSMVDPEEARLAWRALLRRESLEPEARVELYRQIAGRFRQRLRGQGEWIDQLPDEALIRGVLDVVLERS